MNTPPNISNKEWAKHLNPEDTEGHCHKCLEEGHDWPLSDCYFQGEYWCAQHFFDEFGAELDEICAEVLAVNMLGSQTYDVSTKDGYLTHVVVFVPAENYNGGPFTFRILASRLDR